MPNSLIHFFHQPVVRSASITIEQMVEQAQWTNHITYDNWFQATLKFSEQIHYNWIGKKDEASKNSKIHIKIVITQSSSAKFISYLNRSHLK